MADWREKQKEELKRITRELFSELNTMGTEKVAAEILLDAICNEHRTLQQCFWKVMKEVMAKYAERAWQDARNEDSVEFCRLATEATKDHYMRFI